MLPALFVHLLAHPLACLEPPDLHWTRVPRSSVALGVALDLTRSKPECLLENALFRQQLVILERQVNKLLLTRRDRLSLLLLASRLPSWKQALTWKGALPPDVSFLLVLLLMFHTSFSTLEGAFGISIIDVPIHFQYH